MSVGLDKDVGAGFMAAAVPLMKEYSRKLAKTSREIFKLAEEVSNLKSDELDDRTQNLRDRINALIDGQRRLIAAVEDLDRRVSQMIEHGQLDSELDRVELRLRLADLEAALCTANASTFVSI